MLSRGGPLGRPDSVSESAQTARFESVFDNGAMKRILLVATLACLPAWSDDSVSLVRTDHRIEVSVAGKAFTTFYFGPDAPKPYLHPLRAADGTIVTRSYPMEKVEGEQRDHPHHRGVWFSHGEVNGVDFWASEVEQRTRGKKGVIALDRILAVESGASEGRIEASFAWNDLQGARLLKERRVMRFSRVGDDNLVDFDIALTAETDTVHFGDTKEGTFAVRMATELEEPHWRAEGIARTGKIVNAGGKSSEANTWGKRSTWVDYSGTIAGKSMGVAIFDHPGNPKHPTYWHVRGYGLFAANIFGEHDFYADDSRDGSVTLGKGETLRFRYRVLVHPGRTADADLERKHAEWSKSSGGD